MLHLRYKDTDKPVNKKAVDIYKDIANDVETRSVASNYHQSVTSRPLTGKNERMIELMKDELGGKWLHSLLR